jgi:RNA 2',3'-cyclic 3'-phosphodiesterase
MPRVVQPVVLKRDAPESLSDMRLFYAVEFPDPVKAQLAALSHELAAVANKGRWTRQENIHLTIQFLGDCPADCLPVYTAILRESAAASREFSLTISGCGTFGNRHDILWVGARQEPLLVYLAEQLRSRLRQNNLPFDERPFTAHITLGREVQIDPAFLKSWQYAPVTLPVREITLMESTQINGKLTYTPLERAGLTR